jgi:hypothetical protein
MDARQPDEGLRFARSQSVVFRELPDETLKSISTFIVSNRVHSQL